MSYVGPTPGAVEPRYGCITAEALSPGGRFLCCASSLNYEHAAVSVEIWDLQEQHHLLLCTSEEGRQLGRTPEVILLAWSHDSRYLALGRENGTLEVWEIAWEGGGAGTCAFTLQTGDMLQALAWSGRTRHLAAATRDQLLYWEPGQNPVMLDYPPEQKGRSFYHRDVVRAIAFSPDERYLVTGDEEGHMVLWGVGERDLRVLAWWVFSSEIQSLALAWSPDSERIIANGHWSDDPGFVHREETAIRLVRTHHTFRLSTDTMRIDEIIGWSPDGALIATSRSDEHFDEMRNSRVCIELWHAHTGDLFASYELSPRTTPLPEECYFSSLSAVFSADGRHIIWCARVSIKWSHRGEAIPPLWYGALAFPPPPVAASSYGLSFRRGVDGEEPLWEKEEGDQGWVTQRGLERELGKMVSRAAARMGPGDRLTVTLHVSGPQGQGDPVDGAHGSEREGNGRPSLPDTLI